MNQTDMIQGASGSGKSTIIGLIERWYQPEAGVIKLDGTPINELNVNWLRTNVRLVQQEPVLFNGTVFDNIANGLVGTPWENASRDEQMTRVVKAAEFAFAHGFIKDLPEGYDTRIGERGGLLSGGQKQRVAIARSIVSEPKVLLLDEATSALDPHAEGIVQKALDNVSKDRTTIVIAHKLATIRNADNIVVMSKGSILEQGTHDGLLSAHGAYSSLVQAQDIASQVEGEDSEETEAPEDNACDREDDAVAPTMAKHPTVDQNRLEHMAKRDDYDAHKHFGLLLSIWGLFHRTPQLKLAYLLTFLSCAGAGELSGENSRGKKC